MGSMDPAVGPEDLVAQEVPVVLVVPEESAPPDPPAAQVVQVVQVAPVVPVVPGAPEEWVVRERSWRIRSMVPVPSRPTP